MNKQQIIKAMLLGVLGALVGLCIGKFSSYLPNVEPLLNIIRDNLIFAMFIPTILGILGIMKFISIRNAIKSEQFSDEEGSIYEKNQHMLQATMSTGTLTHILNFMFTGMNMYYIRTSGMMVLLTIVIVINVVIAMYLEVGNINLVKKMEPEKNADPTSFKYNLQAIDTLDERELILSGKAALKTDAIMPMVYAIFFVAGILVLAPPMYFVGVLSPWGINVMVKTIHMMSEKKGR